MTVIQRLIPLSLLVICISWIVVAPPPAKVIVGEETTRLDGPIRPDGTIDYVPAIDRKLAEGVTGENNAMVSFVHAFGPRRFDDVHLPALKRLGLEKPAEKGLYLTDFWTMVYAEADVSRLNEESEANYFRSGDVDTGSIIAVMTAGQRAMLRQISANPKWFEDAKERLTLRMSSPWARADDPLYDCWLRVNEGPLKLIEEGAKRSRFYWPWNGGEPSSVRAVLLPDFVLLRHASRMLMCRAMARFNEGDVEGAWKDCMINFRMARLVSHDPNFLSQLVAISLDSMTQEAVVGMAASGKLTAAQARRMVAEMRALTPPSDIARSLDIAERAAALDFVAFVLREGPRGLLMYDGTETDERSLRRRTFDQKHIHRVLDPNVALRHLNHCMDRLLEAVHKPTCLERLAAAAAFKEDFSKQRTRFGSASSPSEFPWTIARWLLLSPEKRREFSSELFAIGMSVKVFSGLELMISTADVNAMNQELAVIALALAGHRAEHGRYPGKLDHLAPAYVPAVPEDRFAGKVLRYETVGDGYLLYSIGQNQRDDGGRADDSLNDLVIRVAGRKRVKE